MWEPCEDAVSALDPDLKGCCRLTYRHSARRQQRRKDDGENSDSVHVDTNHFGAQVEFNESCKGRTRQLIYLQFSCFRCLNKKPPATAGRGVVPYIDTGTSSLAILVVSL